MKRLAGILAGAVGVAALVAASVVYKNYDEWFTFPPLRKIVTAQLKDPASAQFRDERISRLGWLCGELNSKNGMGGYVGFKRYIVSGSGEAYLQDVGYVGVAREQSTAQIIEMLDEKTAVLKRLNKAAQEGALKSLPTDSEMNDLIQKSIFDKKWGQVCEAT